MRILFVIVAILGIVLTIWSGRARMAAQDRRTQKLEQAMTDAQRQSPPAVVASSHDDAGERDWKVVGFLGAAVFLSGLAGIVILQRKPNATTRNAA